MSVDDAVSVTRRSVIRLTGAALTLPAAAPLSASLLENRRMSFTPNFVDLVRNYTTTTGTADFKLGAAVNGYTPFTAALQVGASFYYAALGVDKPAEREVGRGTLLANGIVKREPISGTKTNFTSGTKTLSLVAAAEWFNAIQAGSGAAAAPVTPAVAASRAALAGVGSQQLPALLTESGREGLFVFDAANCSVEVAADPQQAIYIAAAGDPTGASGAWVRRFDGAKSARWFGAKGDGTTDDHAALQAWLDAGGELHLPAGEYISSATLILRKHAIVEGAGYGFDARQSGYARCPGSRIVFGAAVSGLEIQNQGTMNDIATAIAAVANGSWAVQEGGSHSRIVNIALIGAGTGAAATGLTARTVVQLHNVHVLRFQGKAFDIVATSDTPDGNEYGNANQCLLVNCHAKENGSHGFHLRGRDVNACTIIGCNAQLNGGWGFLDESLLGNNYIQPHIATNTLGAIKATGAVAGNKFDRPYIEVGTGSNCQIGGNNTVIGSDLTLANSSPDAQPTMIAPGMSTFQQLRVQWPFAPETLGSDQGRVFNYYGLTLQGRGSACDVSLVDRNGAIAAYVPAGGGGLSINNYLSLSKAGLATFDLSDQSTGSGAQIQLFAGGTRQVQIYGGGGVGYISADTLKIRDSAGATDTRVTIGAAGLNMATGKVIQVDGTTVIDAARNVTAASLSSAGAIASSGGGIGYAAGAGGSVTQATSKSTAVTLNKLSGRITTTSASLAAAGVVSFTVNNSLVAATDTVILNLQSGNATAGAYRYWVEGVSAGAFKVVIENRSAGALAEALVFSFALLKAVTA